MADTADIENALVALIAGSIMPTTYLEGAAEQSTLGPIVRLYRGWPVSAKLGVDIANSINNVTIFPRPEEHNTTRYPRTWYKLIPHVHTITGSIADNVVTLGGVVSVPQNVALVIDGVGYVYPVLTGNSLANIASSLAALVNVDTPAVASGNTITFADASEIIVRVGGVATYTRELKRQNREYQVSFWCADPKSRDALAGPIDVVLAKPQWLITPDTISARLRYVRSYVSDLTEKVGYYRRDLCYDVEYGTMETILAPEVVLARGFVQETFTPPPSPTDPPPFIIEA